MTGGGGCNFDEPAVLQCSALQSASLEVCLSSLLLLLRCRLVVAIDRRGSNCGSFRVFCTGESSSPPSLPPLELLGTLNCLHRSFFLFPPSSPLRFVFVFRAEKQKAATIVFVSAVSRSHQSICETNFCLSRFQ